METLPVKQLIKTAFITAPLMALMLITPVFILTGFEEINFFALWALVSTAVTVSWMINIGLIVFIKGNWIRTWLRILLCSSFMIVISYIVFFLVDHKFKVDSYKIDIIRTINILAVNTIIYMLIDLTITRDNKNKMALENANLKLVYLESEYKLLKDQINPHFLFNALSTAKALVKQQPLLAEEYIVKLSDFLRASINNNRKTVSLKDELALCHDFISLNQIRFGKALHFECDIQTDDDKHFVPYFSILSLLENAIKHNQFTLETPLLIQLFANDDEVTVKNNRQTKFRLEDSPKTGLKNLNERYILLTDTEISIEETVNQFLVRIKLLKK